MSVKLHVFASILLLVMAGLFPAITSAAPPNMDRNGPDHVGVELRMQQLGQASKLRDEGNTFLKAKSYDKAIQA